MDVIKRVLVQPSGRAPHGLLRLLAEVPGAAAAPSGSPPRLTYRDLQILFHEAPDAAAALEALRRQYFNLLVLDLRGDDAAAPPGERLAAGLATLDALDALDPEERFGFHRVLALVSGEGDDADRAIAALAARGVGRVLRERPGVRDLFAQQALAEMRRVMLERARAKTALCLAGGGVTGVYFELGALKALDDCLPEGALNRFDLLFGISAGAVVGGMLANGYSVDEFMAGIAGVPGGRVPAVNLKLARPEHVDVAGLARRALLIAGDVLGRARARLPWSARRRRLSPPVDPGRWAAPLFRTAGYERMLRVAFSAPGATDDFRRLPGRLLVGATDQDLRAHVLFGDPGQDHVPVSRAIAASMAINPAFGSVEIEGRWYTDGFVTRTSNFLQAIQRGADLILAVDPFLPFVSKKPGFARDRGLLYNIDQDVRALSFTRFEKTRNALLHRHPGVSMFTFLPANHLRRLLAEQPLDHRQYLAIWRGAYLATLRRLAHLRHRLRGDFAAHGLRFDLARAEEVGRRLEAVTVPAFSDFFPDRRVVLRRPPLALEAATQPPPYSEPVEDEGGLELAGA